MNILIDVNPKTLTIDGKDYRINTDFRISILFEQLIQDRKLSEKEKMAAAINLYLPIKPNNINTMAGLNEIMDKIVWFYKCGDETVYEPTEGGKPLFCYEHDADYIYAAFLSQYNIDLQDDTLHWWKFRALFKSLSEEHQFSKIIGYRDIKITSDMSNEQKAFYSKMKHIYRIPDKRTIEEIEQDFVESIDNMF